MSLKLHKKVKTDSHQKSDTAEVVSRNAVRRILECIDWAI